MKYRIEKMMCTNCSNSVKKAIESVQGVECCNVSLFDGTAEVTGKFSDALIRKAVKKYGYKAYAYEEKNNSHTLTELILSIVFLLFLMLFSMGVMTGFIKALSSESGMVFSVCMQILFLTLIIVLNFHYFRIGIKNIIRLDPNMDSLIALGSLASIFYSLYSFILILIAFYLNDYAKVEMLFHDLYFESAGMILVFVSIGKYLESLSKKRTTKAVSELIKLKPSTGRRIILDVEEIVDTDKININDTVKVIEGEKIPLDGVIIKGEATIDESMITGEAIPVYKRINDKVIGGTILKEGVINVCVLKRDNEGTFAQIIKLVQESSNSKAPISRIADKISKIFVPLICLFSLITFAVWLILSADFSQSLQYAIAVLVISCPCAFGLATPVAIMVGTGVGAKMGILFKDAESLEALGKVKTIVFDKTGTLTEGKMEVTDSILLTEKASLIASSLESLSNHPLSNAIKALASDHYEITNYVNHIGMGLEGTIDKVKYYIGNKELMDFAQIDVSLYDTKKFKDEGKTLIYLGDTKLLGIFALRDKIRSDAKETVERLRNKKIKAVLLTGDNEDVAKAINNKIHFDLVYAKKTPGKKAEIIKELKNDCLVAMIGDGINDSVALSLSDVGIAMNNSLDVAIESSNIVLLNPHIKSLMDAYTLSNKVIKIIKENLFWALFYNVLMIPLASGAFSFLGLRLKPSYAAIAMSLSSIFVLTNALRINKFWRKRV